MEILLNVLETVAALLVIATLYVWFPNRKRVKYFSWKSTLLEKLTHWLLIIGVAIVVVFYLLDYQTKLGHVMITLGVAIGMLDILISLRARVRSQ